MFNYVNSFPYFTLPKNSSLSLIEEMTIILKNTLNKVKHMSNATMKPP